MVRQLLPKKPEDRPQTATEVAYRLCTVGGVMKSANGSRLVAIGGDVGVDV